MHNIQYNLPKNIISHSLSDNFEQALKNIKQKILKSKDDKDSSALEKMEILEQLITFPLGRFLIQNRGLNGAWMQYIMLHPQYGRLTDRGVDGKPLSQFEKWILDRCPIVQANQERFFISQKLLQGLLKDSIRIASLPCGLMDELLGLNFRNLKDFTLTGIDLDTESLSMAKENSEANNLTNECSFIEKDAFKLNIYDDFDVISCNGLNIYEADVKKNIQLYTNIFNALKADGVLITSFVTIPIHKCENSEWDISQICERDLRLQKILLSEIIDIRWKAAYSDESSMKKILKSSGFSKIKFIYDRQRFYPTVIAIKKLNSKYEIY